MRNDAILDRERVIMQFRLTYEGLLLGASRRDTRAQHKHDIRKVLHTQLKRLHSLHPAFAHFRFTTEEEIDASKQFARSTFETFNRMYKMRLGNFERYGYRFLPLATKDTSLLCSVSVLFLRPDVPGGIIRSGDIDNRMKTIFDALRMPSSEEELGGHTPEENEEPFVCLLEDDNLISQASIETDTLLQPIGLEWNPNDARLIITVCLAPFGTDGWNSRFI